MKKLLAKAAASIAAGVSIILMSAGLASAQSGSISNTGTGSVNRIIFSSSTDIDISNSNDVDCDIDSDQSASSGNATANGNTTVGNVMTGSASNHSFLGCTVNASNGPRPSQPDNNPGGGQQGGGAVAGVSTGRGAVAGASMRVAALPATGENFVLENLGLVSVIIGIAAIAAQTGVSAYRQSAFKNL